MTWSIVRQCHLGTERRDGKTAAKERKKLPWKKEASNRE